VAGYPSITVPAGDAFGLPVGLSFFGRAWSEALLIKLAYAYEQGTKHRRPPAFPPTVALNGRQGHRARVGFLLASPACHRDETDRICR
jgi:amidase